MQLPFRRTPRTRRDQYRFRCHLRRLAALTALTALLLPAGCSATDLPSLGLPTHGDVQQLPTQQMEQKRVYTAPQEPMVGATPESIVKGFLAALPAGPQREGFQVAKKFLTPSARAEWDTDLRTLIYVSDPELSRQAVAENVHNHNDAANVSKQNEKSEPSSQGLEILVAFKVSGSIDAHGVYAAEDSTKTTALAYELTKTEGQWRISSVPSGIQVMDSDFEQAFRQVNLYQTDVTRRTLIPDVRWFGWRQWRTLAVKELLRGPADWMGASAIRLTTDDVSLDMDSVPNVEGKVQVRLSSSVMDLSDASRALLIRQIRLTLGDGNTGYDLSIKSSAGDDLSTFDEKVTASVESQNSRIYSLSKGALVVLQSPNLLRLAETDQGTNVTALAYASNSGGAVLRADYSAGCLEWQGTSCGPLFEGRRIRAISEGIAGEVWAASFQPESALFVQKGRETTELSLSWLEDRQITDMAISPEGSRIIVALRGQNGTLLRMAGIQRDAKGSVASVSDSAQTIAYVPDLTALTFYDDTTVVYAVSQGKRGLRQLAPGPESVQSLPQGTVALASGLIDDTRGLASLDDLGIVRTVTGSLTTSWTLADSQVSAISSGR